MKKSKPKFVVPLFDLKVGSATRREVARVLDSGWLSSGPKVAAFEKAIGEYSHVRHTVAVSSGTMGLQLALRVLGARKGTEVITTPFTFSATVEAILAVGATPVFADIDPATLAIDPDEVKRKLSRRTTVVMPVDLAGQPADYQLLRKNLGDRDISILADAAHSFGAKYRGRAVASWVDAAVHSFYSTKNLTCGEGGMVISRYKELAEMVRLLSRHGMTTDAFHRKGKSLPTYDVTGPGTKGNMSEIHAAIGLGQLVTFEKEQLRRKKLAERYLERLGRLAEWIETPSIAKCTQPTWHLFIIKLRLSRLGIDRDRFVQLMAERGVECGVHYVPITDLSYYRQTLNLLSRHFPNSSWAGQRVVSLPLYPSMTVRQLDFVCRNIGEVVKLFSR